MRIVVAGVAPQPPLPNCCLHHALLSPSTFPIAMLIDSNIRDQAYQFFIQEAVEFLQILEDGLLNLQAGHGTAEIHAIMRAAHSIKGGAASVELDAIRKIAHQMEDVLRALYQDTVTIDEELEEMLLQAFDCLRTPLMQQIQTSEHDAEHWLQASEGIFLQLAEKLGDAMLGEAELPTAAELGIDIVQVIFSGDVEEGLTRLETVLADAAHPEIAGELRAQAQVFLGVGELVNLSGFVAIANAAEAAIETHPEQARAITQVALQDFRAAQQQVLAGDRAVGGAPSATLLRWSDATGELTAAAPSVAEPIASEQSAEGGAAAVASEPAALDLDFWAAANDADDDLEDDFAFDLLNNLTIDNDDALQDAVKPLGIAETDHRADADNDCFDLSELNHLAFAATSDTDSVNLAQTSELPDLTDTVSDASIAAVELPLDPPLPAQPIDQTETIVEIWATENAANPWGGDVVETDDWLDVDNDAFDLSKVNETVDTDARDLVDAFAAMDELDNADESECDRSNLGIVSELTAGLAAPDPQPAQTVWETMAIETVDLDNAELAAAGNDGLTHAVADAALPMPDEFDLEAPPPAPAAATAPAADFSGLTAMLVDVSAADASDLPDVFDLAESDDAAGAAAAAQTATDVTPDTTQSTITIDLTKAPAMPEKVQTDQPTTAQSVDSPMLSNAIRVDLERLERLNNLVGEMVSQENSAILQNQQLIEILTTVLQRVSRFDHLTRELRGYLDRSQTSHSQVLAPAPAAAPAQPALAQLASSRSLTMQDQADLMADFDPLQMDNYSDLSLLMQATIDEIAQIGEAMRDMTLLTRNAQQTQRHKQQTLREVRSDLLWARMLPIGDILQRFPRMIRDMSRKHGKSVSLKLTGSATLVDKSMLEKLYDPLVHLIRNGFDHGIESIEQRAELGKPEAATLEIRAYHRGSQIYIEVADDGRGIDVDRVIQKAIEKGMVTAAAAAELEPEAVYDLLLQPGFSTCDVANELSGRGVGLDTVNSQIKSLKGNLSIVSVPGKGTTFVMRLPLTLMITKLLVFSINDRLMSVPVDSLRGIVAAPVEQIQTLKNGQFYHWQTQFIPIYPQSIFAKCYALNHQSQAQPHALTLPTKGKVPLLMLAGENQTIALPVDTILYERDLAIKPFGRTVTPPPYIYGCTLLGDGSLVPVLDAQLLITHKQAEIVTRKVALAPPPAPAVDISHATILVVDDSLTTRQTLAAVLQKAGYRVFQAKDGREGVEQLVQHAEIQVVFCDIEMPRMNGFEFLNTTRQTYSKQQLPVVMLSSRSNEKHRQVAKFMGANEYLTKPFLEPELLDVLTTLLQMRVEAMQGGGATTALASGEIGPGSCHGASPAV